MRRVRRRLGVATVIVTLLGLVISTTEAGATPDPIPTGPLPTTSILGAGDPVPVPPELIRDAAGADGAVPLALITGDRVGVGVNAGGQPVVTGTTAAPRAGGHRVIFHTVIRDGQVYVVPNDAVSLLGRGVLDWELFNLAQLAEHAALGTVGEIPVIVTHTGEAGAAQAPQVAGASVEKRFPSISASSVTIDGDGRWWRQVQAATAGEASAGRSPGGPLAGVDKVWLNGVKHVSLDESVPQIGTGTAWDLGFDGTGVTVAVLDTGIDAEHPDMAGRVVGEADFTLNPHGALDGNGHGTHVAATIAGTGAASGGLRTGVAPGADLLIGKVCTDSGACPDDSVLAGMEWAVQSGADVVNLSLGGGPTDGTDPLSMAVNQLSQASGALFVIAAGNDGPDPYTVSAPGAADEALTVAAVDKSDQMAGFSSRGPRRGDDFPKPDIAAPGVAIVAARAAGTALGTVVDENYVALSGTSMATPHVAGAAAIVAQKNPDLSGREIKALLMSTARDLGHDPFAQGAGRVDVGKAMDPSFFGDGYVNFGPLEFPHEQPASRTIQYTNKTDQPVTLTVDGSLSYFDGTPAPAGMLTLGADEVTVPAQGTAEVSLTIDGSMLDEGDFGGYHGLVTAEDGAGERRVSTRVAAFLEPERFEVTVTVTPPEGVSDFRYDDLILSPMDDRVHLHADPLELVDGENARVFAGTYALFAFAGWTDGDGSQQIALPWVPEVKVNGSTTVRIDLNEAKPLRVDTPEPTEVYDERLDVTRTSEQGRLQWITSLDGILPTHHFNEKWWVLPTDPVSTGTFNYLSSHTLIPPAVTMRALGGGRPVSLEPRYYTQDVSAFQAKQVGPGGVVAAREVWVPIPRMEGTSVAPVVYAGTGSDAELAGVDADGALVLLTPTDICVPPTFPEGLPDTCAFHPLRERVAAAADAGAIGVLVANRSGLRVELQSPGGRDPYDCPDGWDSCPEVEPYAALPILTLPAVDANELIDRLERHRPTRILIRGQAEVSRVYALSFAGDRIPDDWPVQIDEDDLNRVEHRIHADRPGEVHMFRWSRFTPATPAWVYDYRSNVHVDLPTVATQRSVTVLVGRHPDAVDRFRVGTIEFAEPFVRPDFGRPGQQLTFYPHEERDIVLSGPNTISWDPGPRVPGAVPRVTTDSGFGPTMDEACAGCREGNWFSPQMYLTSSSGSKAEALVGMHNGFLSDAIDVNSCEPPTCQLRLRDEAGNEYQPQSIRLVFG